MTEVDVEKETYNVHNPADGPLKSRSCRDVVFILLFVAFWVGMWTLAGYAVENGDPYRLLLFKDWQGNRCDTAKGYDGYKYLYVPSAVSPSIFICAKECPSAVNVSDPIYQYNPLYTYNILGECNGHHVCDVGATYDKKRDSFGFPLTMDSFDMNTTSWDDFVLEYEPNLDLVKCWCPYNAKKLLTICYPKDLESLDYEEGVEKYGDELLGFVESIIGDTSVIEKVYGDFVRVWWIFPVAAGVAIVMGFTWLLVLRLFAGVLVWITILVVGIGLALLTSFLYNQADAAEKEYEDDTINDENKKRNAELLRYAAIAISVIDVILVVILIFMRKRIQIAIGVIKEASKAMAAMPAIIFFPFVPFVMLLMLLTYWVYVALYLATIEVDDENLPESQVDELNQQIRGLQLYHFFGLLWSVNTIIAITQCSIAGAIASWYWTLDKSKAPLAPVISSFYRVLRYHLGSMIFGALIIAIVQFIRAILAYIQKQMEGKDNLVVKVAFCLLNCCFACVERFLKFINKNAYIMISIYGYSFCEAARKAFFLILANVLRVAAVTMVGDFMIFLGKV
eukprot:TRINITY_DN5038_c0_g1_i3.p1 TRINITY_DN5038_c0_g1~~TRINITY_DN5038_c0_g1_i3.p1  ORF type:complete len:565 (+),score=95.56 TRINITY_DN5038_c0_g1_i3:86-1780(+)